MSTAGKLADRYLQLQELKRQVETELAAVENGLRAAGLLSIRGPVPKAPTHTVAQAREAHRLHQHGDRSEWVQAGERQYQRESKRNRRGAA